MQAEDLKAPGSQAEDLKAPGECLKYTGDFRSCTDPGNTALGRRCSKDHVCVRLFFATWTVYYLVVIPHPTGGNDEYLIEKPTGLFDAVRRALVIDEERLGRRSDDTGVTVIEDGQQSMYWNSAEHNAKQRQWRAKVGAGEVTDTSSGSWGTTYYPR